MRSPRLRITCAVAVAALMMACSSAGASIWTPITSGTTQDITAIEYQSDSAAWFATSNGQIFYMSGGAFILGGNFPGNSFDDIAFRPDGSIGYAVTLGGAAYRSTDGGHSWRALTLPAVNRECAETTPIAVPRLNAVVWADANTAYLLGGSSSSEPVVLKTTNAAAGSPTFTSVNSNGVRCLLGHDGEYVTDGFAVPGNANALFFMTEYFGSVYQSSDGFASALTKSGEMINNFANVPRMAVDPNNPNRIWAVDHGGGSCGDLCFQYSETAGAGNTAMRIVDSPSVRENLYGVGFAGGTLVAAGDGGEIYTSVDGKNAYLQPADGALATTGWRAVGVADATHALVGGTAGALAITTAANSIPTVTTTTTTTTTTSTSNNTTQTTGTRVVFVPVRTVSFRYGPDVVSLQTPASCVRSGVVTARIAIASRRRKGHVVLKVAKVIFKVDRKAKKTKKRAPFVHVFHLHLRAGSRHTLSAQIFIKTHHGRQPHKTLSNTFTACS